MIKSAISPSLMCADICALKETLKTMEDNNIEFLHIDIMDGHFVPNFTLGTDYCKQLRKHTNIPLDIHFMIEEPGDKLEWFDIQPGEWVSVHYECCTHLQRVLAQIKSYGAHPMVVLNPATPAHVLENVLDDIDGVLIMSVNPGFAGQKMIPQSLKKLAQTRKMLDEAGRADARIEVDGNVSLENAVKMRAAGADIFVAGTASLFKNGEVTAERIAALREACK